MDQPMGQRRSFIKLLSLPTFTDARLVEQPLNAGPAAEQASG
jgi:hypothetical protein